MQQRKRRPGHWYSVYSAAYIDEATRVRLERGEMLGNWTHLLTTQNFYLGSSQAQAERSFSRAALAAMSNPLAREIVMKRDHEVIIRVKVEH
jgi:hypothetical protein